MCNSYYQASEVHELLSETFHPIPRTHRDSAPDSSSAMTFVTTVSFKMFEM